MTTKVIEPTTIGVTVGELTPPDCEICARRPAKFEVSIEIKGKKWSKGVCSSECVELRVKKEMSDGKEWFLSAREIITLVKDAWMAHEVKHEVPAEDTEEP